MQALIDFDGWRKWKDFSQSKPSITNQSKPSTTNNNNNESTKKAGTSGIPNSNKSPKGNVANGKVQAPVKREREKMTLSLGMGREGSGEGNDATDSGSGGEVLADGRGG